MGDVLRSAARIAKASAVLQLRSNAAARPNDLAICRTLARLAGFDRRPIAATTLTASAASASASASESAPDLTSAASSAPCASMATSSASTRSAPGNRQDQIDGISNSVGCVATPVVPKPGRDLIGFIRMEG